MQPFHRHSGKVVPLPQRSVDTDQIIPARFLHRRREEGYGELLFADLRWSADGTAKPGFVLNRPEYAHGTILVTGDNFGCGSAREHAVWALLDYGFRVVIAPSIGDIFFSNALQNGLLGVVLPEEDVGRLLEASAAAPGLTLDVDLEEQTLRGPGIACSFEIDPYRKEALRLGLSDTEMTLRDLDRIEAFESAHRERSPWLANPAAGSL